MARPVWPAPSALWGALDLVTAAEPRGLSGPAVTGPARKAQRAEVVEPQPVAVPGGLAERPAMVVPVLPVQPVIPGMRAT